MRQIVTCLLIAFLALLLAILLGTGFSTWQRQKTEQACIAAGREMFADHCANAIAPGETRIE